MTLQTRAPENFRSCRWGDEWTVKRAQTGSEDPYRRERKFLFFFLPPLFKTTEEVVVGFQIFAWAPKKNNKNSGKKIKFAPPPPGLGGAYRFVFLFFLKISKFVLGFRNFGYDF